jgi:adenylate cyclase class 2
VQFEVENKFPCAHPSLLEARLRELDAVLSPVVTQVDQYFAHPTRDFTSTDEALRTRQVGDQSFITYKGPKIDKTTKTRRELELPLAVPADRFVELLDVLGFRWVAEVRKQRRSAVVMWQGTQIEVLLDEVEGLGEFVELEMIAEEDSLACAKAVLQSLADHLELANCERRSYLELLLDAEPG